DPTRCAPTADTAPSTRPGSGARSSADTCLGSSARTQTTQEGSPEIVCLGDSAVPGHAQAADQPQHEHPTARVPMICRTPVKGEGADPVADALHQRASPCWTLEPPGAVRATLGSCAPAGCLD